MARAGLLASAAALAKLHQGSLARCDAPPPSPAASLKGGTCPRSGLRYFAARSRPPEASSCRSAALEALHAFALAESHGKDGGEAASKAAKALPVLTARAFAEGVAQVPHWVWTGPDGALLEEEEAAARAWAEALSVAFARCDEELGEEPVSAVLCIVARSGIYISSVGISRCVIGTEADQGDTVYCDEASVPHDANNAAELARVKDAGVAVVPPVLRFLGGRMRKASQPGLISLPDVVRARHPLAGRCFVLLGTSNLWTKGPRLPVHWAVQAFREGSCPASAWVRRAGVGEEDAAAMVLVLPPGLAEEDSPLPNHGDVT
ncbi:unnamed protein product [Symbiodinium natans]|uniref:PPM-type phosphatase domain-containing protein n=1 Tax=Symbiodinium natans TaxID=878477 RepID=A0A812T835_9DINO|nr:unnamed protein product [Symbiodinium natans]